MASLGLRLAEPLVIACDFIEHAKCVKHDKRSHCIRFNGAYNTYMEYKSNNNVVYSCKYHVVWCPKYRRKVLVGAISERLKELIEQKCSEIKADIIEMEIMSLIMCIY